MKPFVLCDRSHTESSVVLLGRRATASTAWLSAVNKAAAQAEIKSLCSGMSINLTGEAVQYK